MEGRLYWQLRQLPLGNCKLLDLARDEEAVEVSEATLKKNFRIMFIN